MLRKKNTENLFIIDWVYFRFALLLCPISQYIYICVCLFHFVTFFLSAFAFILGDFVACRVCICLFGAQQISSNNNHNDKIVVIHSSFSFLCTHIRRRYFLGYIFCFPPIPIYTSCEFFFRFIQ